MRPWATGYLRNVILPNWTQKFTRSLSWQEQSAQVRKFSWDMITGYTNTVKMQCNLARTPLCWAVNIRQQYVRRGFWVPINSYLLKI